MKDIYDIFANHWLLSFHKDTKEVLLFIVILYILLYLYQKFSEKRALVRARIKARQEEVLKIQKAFLSLNFSHEDFPQKAHFFLRQVLSKKDILPRALFLTSLEIQKTNLESAIATLEQNLATIKYSPNKDREKYREFYEQIRTLLKQHHLL